MERSKQEKMARVMQLVLVLLAALIIGVYGEVGRAFGQSPGVAAPSAASPSPDCFTVLATNIFACLSFVEPGSNLSKPEKDCCPGLSGIVDNSPQCLCQLLVANTSDFGFEINRTQALSLPSACKLSTPPLSLCSCMITIFLLINFTTYLI